MIQRNGDLFSCSSGQFYVDRKSVPEGYLIYIIDNKIYKVRFSKTNGYGLVTGNYRGNRKLRRRLENIDMDTYQFTLIKDKMAFDKYGIVGMNGVVEITHK